VIYIKVNLLVKSCLRNEKKEYNIRGIYSDKIIKYMEQDTLMIIDLKNYTLERSNNDYKINFDFKKNKVYLNEDDRNFTLDIDLIEIKVLDNYFKVKYKIVDDCFELEVKVIDN